MIDVPMMTLAAALVAFAFGIAADLHHRRQQRHAANNPVVAERDSARK